MTRPRGRPPGLSVGKKLTQEKASEIRKLYAAGGVTQKQLAEKFSVSKATITGIVNGRTW